ncbi:hypothetical protein [Sharpea azabuensis]|uniref:hypothetical protein n=1 Tax=Sharpea azabuensis TaxID=322505 RepID=UPI002E7FFF74|nr:hypothetical protein [Sharpea azabuensis]MEE3309564.1 hypothetical protein [Sharpea azabuensis]
MRPIDADRLKNYVITITQIALSHQGVTDGGAMSDAMAFCRTVDRQPTLNVMRKAELKGATWLPIYSEDVASDKERGWTDTFKCSACECYTTLPNMVRESEMDYEYCPHCGRKMFEDEDE